ncbi:MAG: type VI secretion protein IcmF/TssM N-terminal domain-containing protein, partial [Phycisphaerales bacterium]
MPKPLQAGLLLATGAGLVATLNVLFPTRLMQTLGFVVALAAVVALIYLAYHKILLPLWDKRKANPFTKAVSQNAGAAPQSISDPAKRARLDDLRKAFETGIDKYKQAGKNIYSVPWYLVVGEPGSGKTEAVRHSGIGFPPGLQDPLQGAGGTLNMNWWFSNPAVLLDTAGRLMFEEAAPGHTTEWQELLKNLVRFRPNCPINGMLLFIPADSVIRDTSDAIERKAARIAAQLDATQRALGIRFPVFVVISKCDLINGFRDFFDSVDDPSLQHQMLGWSNPASLDTPFRPEMVEDHLTQVRDRLIRRRQIMLEDPVHSEDSSARRADQVDALFSFPESMMQIAPRLRKYLEMIFVSGEWSNKPLFPRGIYFTSSMREGSALDAELAEALGVSIESLPEGKVWERERAYFLRDLFMSKIFKERGLVTRAGNVRKAQQRRRAMLLGSGILTALILIGLSFFSTLTYKSSVGNAVKLWSRLAEETKGGNAELYQAIEYQTAGPKYSANSPLKKGDPDLVSTLEDIARNVKDEPIRVPVIFRVASGLTGDVERRRLDAARSYFTGMVVRPGIVAALARFSAARAAGEKPFTSDEATTALSQLVRGASLAEEKPEWASNADRMIDADSLYLFALGPASAADATPTGEAGGEADSPRKKYETRGQEQFKKVHDALFGARGDWPRWMRVAMPDDARRTLDDAKGPITTFLDWWQDQAGGTTGELAQLAALKAAMEEFDRAEAELLKINEDVNDKGREVRDMRQYGERIGNVWPGRYRAVDEARNRLTAAAKATKADEGKSGEDLREQARKAVADAASRQFRLVQDEAGPGDDAGREPAAPRGKLLKTAWGKLNGSIKQAADALVGEGESGFDTMVSRHLAIAATGAARPMYFDLRADAYKAVDGVVSSAAEAKAPEFGQVSERMKAAVDAVIKATDESGGLLGTLAGTELKPFKRAKELAGSVARLAGGAWLNRLIEAALTASPVTAEKVAEVIASKVTPELESGDGNRFPSIPMTAMQGGSFDREYHPKAAKLAFDDWAAIESAMLVGPDSAALSALDGKSLATRAEPTRESWRAYAQEYMGYWTARVPLERARVSDANWAEFHRGLGNVRANMLPSRSGVNALWQMMRDAVLIVPVTIGSEARTASLTQLDGEIKLLKDGGTWDFASDAMKKWLDLGEGPSGARGALLNVPCDDLKAKYFVAYPGKERDAEAGRFYWNSLFLAGLTSLGNDTLQNATAALTKLTDQAAFPVCREVPGVRVLQATDIANALAWARELPEAAKDRGQMIRQGCEADRPQIDERLRRLTGKGFLDASGERWLERVRPVLEFLGAQQRMDCEVSRASAQAQSDVDGGFSGMAFGVKVDLGDGIGPRDFWQRVADDRQPILAGKDWTVAVPGARSIRFI